MRLQALVEEIEAVAAGAFPEAFSLERGEQLLRLVEELEDGVRVSRVAVEVVEGWSEDGLAASGASARSLRLGSPYARFGVVAAAEEAVPRYFPARREGLDFALATGGLQGDRLRTALETLLRQEVFASRQLEDVAYGRTAPYLVRNALELEIGEDRQAC